MAQIHCDSCFHVGLDCGLAVCVDCALDDLDTLLHDDVAREQSARHEGQVAHWPRGPVILEFFLNCFVRLADFFE